MINLFSICLASFFWFRYMESRLNPDHPISRRLTIASMVPLGIALILIVTSPLKAVERTKEPKPFDTNGFEA